MIKGITFIHRARAAEELEALADFFCALGLEAGRGWSDELSQGRPLITPSGNLELVFGEAEAASRTLIEVTSIEDVREVAANWLKQHGHAGSLTSIEPTRWKSRLFTAEPFPGAKFSFWEWEDPLKDTPAALAGDLIAAGMRFAVVVARWNAVITDRLLASAVDCLVRSGCRKEDISVVRVPGSWEIPAAARTIAASGQVEAIITLGCLLRGQTAHYEAIYNEVARGIGQSQQETGVPHSFGVLTCETLEQALDRAGLKSGNKGFEAASAAIEMASLRRKLHAAPRRKDAQ